MTRTLTTARPRTVRSDAAIVSLPADADMSYAEHCIWYAANVGEVERRVAAMPPAERAAWAGRIGDPQ